MERMAMTDPINEAEGGVEAFAQLECLAAETHEGTITLRVNAGVVTSVVAERVFPPTIAAAAANWHAAVLGNDAMRPGIAEPENS